jgi:uncharacterized repeat protein (TIGR02543 family)
MGLTRTRATFMPRAKRSLHHFLALVIAVSTLSAISVFTAPIANASSSTIDSALRLTKSSNMNGYSDSTTAPLQNLATYTVEAWIKPTTNCAGSVSADTRCEILLRDGDYDVSIIGGNYKWVVYHGGSAVGFVDTGIRALADSWSHIALTRNGTAIAFYVNGVSRFTQSIATGNVSTFTNYPFRIGYAGYGSNYFDGQIDEVKLWSVARTASEITSLMSAAPSLTDSTLLAYYNFNEGSGTTVNNQKTGSASTSNLTLYGSPTWSDVKTESTSSTENVITFPRSYINSAGGWTAPAAVTSVRVLLVGGGGGGGAHVAGGGGGGGVVDNSSVAVTSGTAYSIAVAAGGTPATKSSSVATNSTSGGDTTAFGITAFGGGGGGSYHQFALSRATGGGAALEEAVVTVLSTIVPAQGFAGGSRAAGDYGSRGYPTGGGGGAGGAGGNGNSGSGNSSAAGAGGIGKISNITGADVYYGGGGGGNCINVSSITCTSGAGGAGGGGAGKSTLTSSANTFVNGNSGTANTGGGGGGTGGNENLNSHAGGAGGSGVVIVKYALPTLTPTFGTPTFASGSWTIPITNYDAAFTWGYSASNGTASAGTASGSTINVTVTPTANTAATLTATTSRTGFANGTATSSSYRGGCGESSVSSGGYTYIAFKTVATCFWGVPAGVTSINYLVVGGGGGGATRHAGGGGAGGLLQGTASVSSISSLSLTIGDGGAGAVISSTNYALGTSGNSSTLTKGSGSGTFAEITALGGGGGTTAGDASKSGGSGGGALNAGGAGTAGQGNAGGTGRANNPWWGGGGGGGAGGAGSNASQTAAQISAYANAGTAGDGGVGLEWSNSGFTTAIATSLSLTNTSNTLFAGGGGGGATAGTAGLGGSGGGGAGTAGSNSNGVDGLANTGGGGGGGGLNGNFVPQGGKGGSGVVLIRYVNAPSISLVNSTISSTVGSAVTSYSITSSAGPLSSYAIPSADSTALTNVGLSFSTSTGLISGTPSGVLASRSITITGTNSTGTTTATFTLATSLQTCSSTSSTSGGYTVITIPSTTDCNWTAPTGVTKVNVVVIGGGGGGGGGGHQAGSTGGGGGGGGAGEVKTGSSVSVTAGNLYQVAVGSGGSGGAGSNGTAWNGTSANSGGSSSALGITSLGGGGGIGAGPDLASTGSSDICSATPNPYSDGTGGSGGVSGTRNGTTKSCTAKPGGGGGGAGSSAAPVITTVTNSTGVAGGAGTLTNFGTFGVGGTGGSGGASSATPAETAPTNYGDGGFGGKGTVTTSFSTLAQNGSSGAPGAVIISYDITAPTLSSVSASNTSTTGTTLNFTSNETGTYYYKIQSASETDLTLASAVETGATASASANASANAVSISGLTINTSYEIFVTVKDAEGNGATVSKVTFSTLASAVAPTIDTQPTAVSKTVGQSVSFSVAASASDSGDLSYQWQKGGVNISGATGATYTFTPASTSDAGEFRVVVTNTKNSVTAVTNSNAVALTLSGAISITTPTTGLSGTVGTTFSTLTIASSGGSGTNTFSVASGSLPAGLALNSSTGAITGTPTTAGDQAITISVTDSNSASATTSSFTISISPAILSNASAPTVAATAGALKSISVSWTAVTNASSYTLKIYNAAGTSLLETVASLSGTSKILTVTEFAAIANNTAYQISITAIGTGNYSSSSESAKASVTTAATLTLTYEYNSATSGNSDASAEFVTGGTAVTLPTPSRTGYTFDGWYEAQLFSGTKLGSTYSPTQARTIYAKWIAATLAVSFNSNSGSSVSSINTTTGATIALAPTAPTKTGYTFAGWSATDGGTAITFPYTHGKTANFALYAKWTTNVYTVTFVYNSATGGNSVETATVTTALTPVTLPTPTRDGHTFDKWYAESTFVTEIGAAGATYMPTGSSLTPSVYAKWNAISYTVTYLTTNKTSGSEPTDSTNYNIGNNVIIKGNTGSLARTGYTFTGWTAASDGSGTLLTSGSTFTVGTSNMTFTPKWSANTYTITYNKNGASGSPADATASYTTAGTAVTLSLQGTMLKTGFNWGGWSETPTGSAVSDNYTTTSNVTLYAVWTIKTITVTYDKGIASSATFTSFPTSASGNYGTSVTLNSTLDATVTFDVASQATQHRFVGWNDGNSVYQGNTSYLLGATNVTMTANWVKVFGVRYSFNGGTAAANTSATDTECLLADSLCNNLQVITTHAAPTKTGYNFAGWVNQNGTSVPTASTTTITSENYLFYATWTAINYTITYSTVGGSLAPTEADKQMGGTFTVATAPTKTGYNFTGWSDGSTIFGAGVTYYVATSNVTLTAQWSPKTYTVIYDWNGGSGSSTSNSSYTVENAALTLPVVGDHVKDGYTFSGWSETNNGSLLSGGYTPTADITLYAIWGTGSYTTTYDAQGGTVGTTSAAVQNGSTLTLPTPTRANFVFDGWYPATSGGTKIGNAGVSHQPTQSRTMYARWIQASLYGLSPSSLTRIGTTTASSSSNSTFTSSNATSSVSVTVPAGALPSGTTVNFDLVGDFTRAQSVLTGTNSYIISLVVSWLASDGTVPNTADGKPIAVTITNASIKTGMSVYGIVADTVSLLGVATQDGTVTVNLISDPEVVVVATKPGAPTSVAASSNATQQSVVSWSAPSADGGSPITGYTVTSSTSATCSTSTTSCTFTGLADATSYTFTVTATNALGTSAASASASARTAGKPDAPTSVSASANATQQSVISWTAPASNGGSAITGYTATANGGAFCSTATTSCTITGLSDGTTYTFTVTATNILGTSDPSTSASARTASAAVNNGGGGSSGSGGGSSTPAPSEPVVPSTPVKSNVTVVAPVTVVGDQDAKVIAVDIAIPASGSNAKPPEIKVDKASEKFIADVKVVEGKLVLTPETGFSGKKTVTVTITENGTDRIIQIPLTVLPEVVTMPVLTPASANKTIIRWTASPNADAYTVYLYGKKVCSTSATSCSVARVLGPDANVQIISNGGDRTISDKVEAEFKQTTPVAITRIVSATITKATLTKVDTKALDKVVALIKTQGFGTVVISEITTTSKTKALAAARIESIKKYISSKAGVQEVAFEVTPVKSRTYFNNISVKG